ncbi:MAG: NUDIX domain-containing protein, partial [Candidatus Caldatribacteriaceae bacterium]
RSSFKEVQAVVALFFHDGKVLIRRRPEKGFLAGLWELPWKENASIQEVIAENSLLPVSSPQSVGEFSHTYCKRRVKAQVFLVPVDSHPRSLPQEHHWQPLDRLGEYPFSSFHRKALRLFNNSFSTGKERE